MNIILPFNLVLFFIFSSLTVFASDESINPNCEYLVLQDTYTVESYLSSYEVTCSDGQTGRKYTISHIVWRIDEDGKKWYAASGLVYINTCDRSESEEPVIGEYPSDPNCPTVFYSNRILVNDNKADFETCFTDFAITPDGYNQILIDSENELLGEVGE